MLNDAGKLDDVPSIVDPNAPADELSILDRMRLGTIDFTSKDVKKEYLITLATERGFTLEEGATKAQIIDVLKGN
jgi:hypothetical protein